MLVSWNIDCLSRLAFTFSNYLFHRSDDLVNNCLLALDLDGVAILLGLRELDGSRKLSALVRTTSTDDDVSQCRTCLY